MVLKNLLLYVGPKPEFLTKLVDDCIFFFFAFWNHSEVELVQLFMFFNTCYNMIKLTFCYSHDKVTFF